MPPVRPPFPATATRRPAARPGVAVVARDPALLAAILAATEAAGFDAPLILSDEAALLDAVLSGAGGFGQIILETGPGGPDPSLFEAMAEASPNANVLPLGPEAAAGSLARALLTGDAPPAPAEGPPGGDGRPHGQGGLLLRYQPIVRLRDRRLVMVEALARWRGPLVALGPGSFVPALERAGLGRQLAGAVARIAARDMMRAGAPRRLVVSVNLPLEVLEKRDTLSWIAEQLRAARLPRQRMAIELTETSPVRDFMRLGRSVRRLRASGHQVLIDDFEMDDQRRRLLRLPFSGVKLDRGFVERLATCARARQQVRRLAREGLCLTAEGVSSAAIWRSLRHLGVERAQGYWLARPLPFAALPAWAARWRASQAG